jgi:hypothetical protein
LEPLKSLKLLEPVSQTPPLKPLKRLELRKPLPPLEPLEPPERESLRSIVEKFGLQVPYGLGEANDTLFKPCTLWLVKIFLANSLSKLS